MMEDDDLLLLECPSCGSTMVRWMADRDEFRCFGCGYARSIFESGFDFRQARNYYVLKSAIPEVGFRG